MTSAGLPTAELYLYAPENPGQHAPLADFNEACAALRKTLRHVERCISGKDASLEFEVSEVTVASLNLRTAPSTRNPDVFSLASETIRVHRETFKKLQGRDRSLDPRLDYNAVLSFNDFSPTVKRQKVAVAVDGVKLSQDFIDTLGKVLRPIKPSFGSVSGIVKQLDVHGKHTFVLFPPMLGSDVKCSFQPEKFETVRAALKRHVTVFGLMHYGLGRSFPVTADVDDIEIHPPDSELPSLLDMEGMMEGETTTVTGSLNDEWE
ncbi:MAG: hypothetical protein SH850_09375 [Planctomycetaceae bacterium]|nr:hypothetical protein [Planctomycetaceae bacterium]